MKSANALQNLDLSSLPDKWRNNWHIYLCLRSDAQVAYAGSVAGPANNSAEWVAAFDEAAAAWLAANPMDAFWAAGRWPAGAEFFLGNDALANARELVRNK